MRHKTTAKNGRGLLLVLSAAACAFLCGCARQPDESRAQRYELKGTVVSSNKAQQQVVIQHEEVPGFMEAMTMPFTLREEAAYDVMRPGDRIQATLVVDNERTRLENPIITQAIPAAAATPTPADGPTEPEIGALAPDASLVNQDGKKITLQQYRGRALVLTFIYTRCPLPDYCTLMSNNFAELNRELHGSPELRDRAHLLSITLDPAYDTPQVLRSYGAAHTENYQSEKFEGWEFATGQPGEIERVAHFFGLSYRREGEQINHSLRTAIIAPDGKLYKLYRGNEWKPAEVLRDLRALNGTHQPS
ncbi:MAG TPA: SCO family protein [Pyrinomonadaceae bacterium]|nr:SCO family protein [Pyrinomonadaceae bacterium]